MATEQVGIMAVFLTTEGIFNLWKEVSMIDSKELHRRATKSISAKRLAELFRVSEKAIYALSCRSPDVRVIPPIEKVYLIMAELAGMGDVETAAEIAAYLTQHVPEIQVARIYNQKAGGVNEKSPSPQ